MGVRERSYPPTREFKPDGTPNPNYDPERVKPTPPPAPPERRAGSVPDIPRVPPLPDEVEWLGKLTSVNLGPDDVLIVMSPKRLNATTYEHLEKSLKKHFPNHEHVIFEDGMTLGVLASATDKEKPVTGSITTREDMIIG